MFKRLRPWWADVRLKRKYLPQIKAARDKRDNNAARDLEQRYRWEMQEIDDWKRSLAQEKLINKARALYIPVPRQDQKKIEEEDEDDNWYYSSASGDVLLNDKALTELRREVRAAEKERRDLFLPWFSLIVALFGTSAAILSVWLSRAALNHNIESSRLDQRAWVGVKSISLSGTIGKGQKLDAVIVIQNTGRSPALEVIVKKGHGIVYPTQEILAKPPQGSTAILTLPPNNSAISLRTLSASLSEDEIRMLQSQRVYVYGTITYKDVFNNRRETAFCTFYNGVDFPGLEFCSTLNYIE